MPTDQVATLAKYSAVPSLLGYLYQVRYALYALLTARLGAKLSIEKFDDVAFENDGSPETLLQAKHHIDRLGNLTDASTDLWKTIRIWCEQARSGVLDAGETILMIVTTGQAPRGSAAWFLRAGPERDHRKALSLLENVAVSSKNKDLEAAFDEFRALAPTTKDTLFRQVWVLDSSPTVQDLGAEIESTQALTWAVRPEFVKSLRERLEAWWLERVITHLTTPLMPPIHTEEVQARVHDLADGFRPDTLPIDFLDEDPPEDLDPASLQFVRQLRMIAVKNRRLMGAIQDYYRATYQRTRWLTESLVGVGELERYERRLVDEWSRCFEIECDRAMDSCDDSALVAVGQAVYEWAEIKAQIHIRQNCTEPYVMRGSFHMLADEEPPRVGWHPEFVERLKAVALKAVKPAG